MTTDTTASSLQELQDLIHEKYGIDRADLGAEASMRDKGFDSLALVEFLFAVEDHFKISLPDTDENMSTLGQLAALVDELRIKKKAAEGAASTAGGAAASDRAAAATGTVASTATPAAAATPAAGGIVAAPTTAAAAPTPATPAGNRTATPATVAEPEPLATNKPA